MAVTVYELVKRLQQLSQDAIVAIADTDSTLHHLSRTSPQPAAQGMVVILDPSLRLVTEEDLA